MIIVNFLGRLSLSTINPRRVKEGYSTYSITGIELAVNSMLGLQKPVNVVFSIALLWIMYIKFTCVALVEATKPETAET